MYYHLSSNDYHREMRRREKQSKQLNWQAQQLMDGFFKDIKSKPVDDNEIELKEFVKPKERKFK
jgi:hypothetical protein